MTAVGVANPRAQGHATTMTLMADMRAVTYRSSVEPEDLPRKRIQHAKVTNASIITQGAKMDAIRSAIVTSVIAKNMSNDAKNFDVRLKMKIHTNRIK